MMLHFTFPSYDHAADFAKAVPYNVQHEGHEVAVFLDGAGSPDSAAFIARQVAEKYFGLEVWK